MAAMKEWVRKYTPGCQRESLEATFEYTVKTAVHLEVDSASKRVCLGTPFGYCTEPTPLFTPSHYKQCWRKSRRWHNNKYDTEKVFDQHKFNLHQLASNQSHALLMPVTEKTSAVQQLFNSLPIISMELKSTTDYWLDHSHNLFQWFSRKHD